MDHRLGTLQVENAGKCKWFWLLPSLILRGIRPFYADTKITFATGKMFVTQIPTSPCTSHNDETKITSQHTKKLITK